MSEIVKLGSIVTDKATGLEGMVTHLQIEMNNLTQHYLFQPRGLNPETGGPVKKLWLIPERIEGGIRVPAPEMPLQVLGTEVEDQASGFKGMATALMLHITGCFHVTVQPKGRIEKTGSPIEAFDFDIRRLKGPSVPVFTEEQREADQQKKPSPSEVGHFEPSMP